ncbi:beta-ketoacyl synthase N-terminal-like domain-containing protein [Chitinophaga solisilvae]|uniref:beta-ketoacyl synthase N-terminal-like domain-containing protein n=1 Tax=Chitinophaga solisilvae TaxID=1233460 RepID=UPI00136B6945|nr:beta-ketoacyl synthase N-terminal-like domain-containing protein [Chitinophaga solisilvae]
MQDQFFIDIDHPVIHHHRIYGQAILPGLAYIDMIYQFFAEKGFDPTTLTLYDLSIYHPLIVAAGTEILLSLEAVEDGQGRWQVLVDGEEQHHSKPAGKKRYVRAAMQQTTPVVFTETLDTAGVEQRAVSVIELEDIYTACRSREMMHTGLMKAAGRIYNTPAATIMKITAAAVPDVMYHPALIDASAIGGAAAISHLIAGEERLFLPLFYGSFRAAGLLQQECWVRILTDTVQRKEELISFTLEFFNAAGQKLAELKNFSSKLVRDTGLIDPERSAVQQQPEAGPAVVAATGSRAVTAAENLLRQWLAERLNKPLRHIDVQAGYYEMGLDSPGLLELVQALEKKLEITLSPTLLFEYTNITTLAAYLADVCPHRFVKETGEESTVSATPAPAAAPKPGHRVAAGRTDIAVIAMEGRFPGASGVKEFWQHLLQGYDGITAIPADRWRPEDYVDDSLQQGKAFCRWGGFVEEVEMFDPLFFNISPREAASMHPNERLFLETVWRLLENAGYTRALLQEKYQSRVGVFAGAMHQQYQPLVPDLARDSMLMLHSYSAIVNRVSYFFNLQGPSVAIDTMCSSALTALHMACESMAAGQCGMAIVGGVNLSLHPGKYIGLGIAQMLGSDISSRSFADGDGYLPAEAVGAVLLKPLAQAEQDNDNILAVIRSTAVNHGGHSNGYSVPNVQAQVQLMEDNFKAAGIPVSTISYVEAAANGSALGDAIEMTALNKVFGKPAPGKKRCAIGSVKSNIGHAEAASGITQLIKTVLQLQHKKLAPVMHSDKLNPNIRFEETPFYLQQEAGDWPANGTDPRRAAISSFGAGGSNAHVIIEEYTSSADARRLPDYFSPQVIVLSARNKERLEAVVEQLSAFISTEKEIWLPDLAYTLQAGREAMTCRMALVADSKETLVQGLQNALQLLRNDAAADGSVFLNTRESTDMDMADLLSGQLAVTVANALIAENNPEKLAHYWVKGGTVAWEQLHKDMPVQKIQLPVYPFERRKCWMEDAPVVTPLKTMPAAIIEEGGNEEEVIGILARLLGLQPFEIDRHKPLQQYGFDSIQQMQLLQLLQSHGFSVAAFDRMALSGSAHDISRALQPVLQQPLSVARKPATRQFPELLHLNQVRKGRPVFWFHPVLGGVESYMRIAQHCHRPFYGIQARGWMTDRMPLQGIQAMAAYYIHALQSVQPEGPYDLGGYSLGGILAYEITRQLQEMGETVNSIVMLDAVYSPALKMDALDANHKTGILQAVNMMLFSSVIHEPEKIYDTLIHRDAVSMDITDEAYFERMMELANQRGMKKTSAQLHQLIAHSTKLQRGYQLDSYSVQPLPCPEEVKCYFFRNDSGLFYGELSPYFTMSDTAYTALDHLNYWEEWERQLPHFMMTDVASPNHMMLLTAPESCDEIISFCEKLYAGKQLVSEQQ